MFGDGNRGKEVVCSKWVNVSEDAAYWELEMCKL
jgi:hypothetical protein